MCESEIRPSVAGGVGRPPPVLLSSALLVAASCAPAWAHTSERAFVLLLPTDLYIVGGAIVVGVSCLLIALVPAANVRALAATGRPIGRPPAWLGNAASLVSFIVMIALILAGRFGTQDPLANPLPLVVWTLGWIGLTFAHILFGDLWSVINPWRGLLELLDRMRWPGRRLHYPEWLGFWPAFAQFLAFAWFELISTAPRSPEILANAVGLYFVVNLVCALLFGHSEWLRHGEAFSVFFRVVSWLSPFGSGSSRACVTFPGLGLLHVPPLSASGGAFVLLMLASVSFDGLARTYWWLDLIGVNPLAFPGRSAVTLPNTLGLFAAFAVLAGLYGAAVGLGRHLSRGFGGGVASMVPIALGYHFAHTLTAFLVDAQYAAISLGDPFGLGWDLFGLDQAHVTTSFLTNFDSVRAIWHAQVAVIVTAHVVAVSIGHVLAMGRTASRRDAIVGQIPMTLLMIAYTLFGLWLLSTPAIG